MSGVFGDVLRMLSDVTGPDIDINIDEDDVLADIASSALEHPSPGDPLRCLSNSNHDCENLLKPDPKAAWLRGRKRRASSALSLGLDLDDFLPPPSPPPRSSKKKSRSVQGGMTPKFLADMGLRKSLIDILNVFNPTDGADKSMVAIEEGPAVVNTVPIIPPGPMREEPGSRARRGRESGSSGSSGSGSGTDLLPVPDALSISMTVHAVTPQLDREDELDVTSSPFKHFAMQNEAPSFSQLSAPSAASAAAAAAADAAYKLGVNGRKRRNCGAATNPQLAATRNHVCELCQSRFLCKSKLDRHMRTHTGAKPFACYCGKQFNQKSALKNHSRRHMKKGDVPDAMTAMGHGINGFSYASLIEKV
eukprot:m.28330 g.28330  ORF g.28330 m.28330 type:complete len:363 (-) comp12008_c0_seq1:139-1227(-)